MPYAVNKNLSGTVVDWPRLQQEPCKSLSNIPLKFRKEGSDDDLRTHRDGSGRHKVGGDC